MEVTYVMTKEEWGKPIDVAEEWIHFVDDNVAASMLTPAASVDTKTLLNEPRIAAGH